MDRTHLGSLYGDLVKAIAKAQKVSQAKIKSDLKLSNHQRCVDGRAKLETYTAYLKVLSEFVKIKGITEASDLLQDIRNEIRRIREAKEDETRHLAPTPGQDQGHPLLESLPALEAMPPYRRYEKLLLAIRYLLSQDSERCARDLDSEAMAEERQRWQHFYSRADAPFAPGKGQLLRSTIITACREALQRCVESLSPLAAADRIDRILTSVNEEWRRGDMSDEAIVARHHNQRRLADWLLSARGRMRRLDWQLPYRGAWHFVETLIDLELSPDNQDTRPPRPSEPQSSFLESHSILTDASDLRTQDQGSEWEGHESSAERRAKEVVLRSTPLRTLYSRNAEVFAQKSRVSHRMASVAYRLAVQLTREGVLGFDNEEVASTDVAPTAVNDNIPIHPTSFFAATLSTRSVDLEAYNKTGAREFDGLSLIQEDNSWLLMRSNHVVHPILVCVLLVTSDHELLMSLPNRNAYSSQIGWSPSSMGYARISDFQSRGPYVDGLIRSRGPFVDGLIAAAKRQARKIPVIGDCKDLPTQIVGYGLDATYGLRPTVFAVTRVPEATSRAVRDETPEGGSLYRSHPLVADNPRISFRELLGMNRYAQSDLLRAGFYFAHRYFDLVNRLTELDESSISALEYAGPLPLKPEKGIYAIADPAIDAFLRPKNALDRV